MSNNKTALVTGANKGIGREIARRLGEIGYSVWLGCRDAERGERAAAELRGTGVNAHALLLDVTSDTSVAEAAAKFAQESEHLDVLVNNAGIAIGWELPSETRVEDMRSIYEVNTFGPVRVTIAFLPFLRKAEHARIVMMSSSLGSIAAALDPTSETYDVNLLGYNSSKAALNMITVMFAKELHASGIKVNAVNPGHTATDLNQYQGHRTVEEAAEIAIQLATIGANGPTAGFFHDGYFNSPGRHSW